MFDFSLIITIIIFLENSMYWNFKSIYTILYKLFLDSVINIKNTGKIKIV